MPPERPAGRQISLPEVASVLLEEMVLPPLGLSVHLKEELAMYGRIAKAAGIRLD